MSEWIMCPKCGALMIGITGGHICPLCGYRVPAQTITTTTGTSVEYAPVIRCKDCKYNYANIEKDPYDATDYTDIICTYFMTDGMEADDFCSRGEK